MAEGEPALLLSAASFGVCTTVSVVALGAVSPADLLAVEISGAAAILLTTAAVRGRLRWRGAPRQLLLGALMPGLVFLFADMGLSRTSASSGSLLLSAEPLLTVLLALVVLRERLSGRAMAALAVGLGGGALVAFGSGGAGGTDSTLGNVLVLTAVVAAAVFVIATRHFHDDDGLNASAWQNVGGALSVAPFVAGYWFTNGTRLDTAGAGGWLACLGVIACGALGSFAFNRGIVRVPAARAGQLRNLTPVVGTLTAVVFLGDRPSPLQLVGGAAILGGLVLLLRSTADAHTDTPEERSMTDLPDRGPLRGPLFCDTALAGRIERAETWLVTARGDAARRRRGYRSGFAIAIADGVANYAEPDSPLNKVAGLGFTCLPDPAGLDTVEQAFAAHGAPVQVEVASLAEPALLDLLAGRGYRTVSFENVLGRALGGAVEHVTPPGVDIHPSRDDEFQAWLSVIVEASLYPDTHNVPRHREFPRETIENAERDTTGLVHRYLARFNGAPAGGASMRITDGVAQLTGGGTAPAYRRRGIQTALLTARLAVATAAGCEVATVTVQPGSKSQHNAQRHGFNLLYTRAVLTKTPG